MVILETILAVGHVFLSWLGVLIIMQGATRATGIVISSFITPGGDTLSYSKPSLILCRSIIFGMEFMVAADVIKTMIVPDFANISLLGSLVIIRTILSYFLSIEVAALERKGL